MMTAPPPDASYVFLNGRFVRSERAKVSVFDRGLLYGDGLFETMRAYQGVPFALEDHLHRLRRSAEVLGLPVPGYDWAAEIAGLLLRNQFLASDAWVRMTITRGAAPPSVQPPPVATKPTAIIMARAVDDSLQRLQRSGLGVRLLPFERHGLVPEHKSLNYLPTVLGKTLAARHGAGEGIFVRQDGVLTEGTTSSLFLVSDGVLRTPPVAGILPGVTRRRVLWLAERAGIPLAEEELRPEDLGSADEAFLTSSVAEIIPAVRVDQAIVGSGRPGPLTRRLQRLYRSEVRRYVKQVSRGR